jgi:crotonobetainyl-CoA:carnitine CoA-transferase CaiB-like acyl-CoA transferase
MPGVLDGVKVVEVAIYAFGPACGAVLADWGASVIKVEHPETGDPLRGLVAYGVKPGEGGVTYLWEILNRGKRSVGIDVGTPEGKEVLYRLVDEADVFVTNFLAPARRRLGIDVDDLMARNPRLVYARATGHGPLGPDADKGGYDGVSFWARSGVSVAAMPPEAAYPIPLPGPAYGDVQSGAHLAGGVAAALYRREKTGRGGVVDVSLLSSGLWAMQPVIAGAHSAGREALQPLDRGKPANPIWNVYRTADAKFIALSMLESDRYWPELCVVLDRPDLLADERFVTERLRTKNNEALVEIFDEVFAAHTLAEWREILGRQEGPWAATQTPRTVLDDQQALDNGYLQWVKYDNGATLPLVSAPAQIDGRVPTLGPAPGHGTDTDTVLAEAGLSEDDIITLKVQGAIS